MGMFSSNGGAFVKWDVHKTIRGTIEGFRMGTDANDNPAVVVDIDDEDGDTVSVTVAQWKLKVAFEELFGDPEELSELDPFVGRRIAIAYTGDEKVGKGTAKIFSVEVGDAPSATPAAASSLL